MADNAVTIRVTRLMRNPLLQRRQCSIEVLHPGKASVPKKDLREHIAKLVKVKDIDAIIPYGLQIAFGGGRSSGFCHIYDSSDAAKKLASSVHKVRLGLQEKKTKKGRKAVKEAKNRKKKVRGLGIRLARKKARRSGGDS
jgi:small subunit ribosomal protein S24e